MQTQCLYGTYVVCQCITLGLLNVAARRNKIYSYHRYHAAQYIVISAIIQGVFKKTDPLPRTRDRIKVCWVTDAASLGFVAFGVSYLTVASRTKMLVTAGIFGIQFATSVVFSEYTIPHTIYRIMGTRNIATQHQRIAQELRNANVAPTDTWEKCAAYAQGKLRSQEFADISFLYKFKTQGSNNHNVASILKKRAGRYAYFHGTRTIENALSILKKGQIDVMHSGAYPGAFVSTQPESGYGPYFFAFSREIEWDSPLRSGVDFGGHSYWAGFSKPISTCKGKLGCIIVKGSEAERETLRDRILLDPKLGPDFAWVQIVLESEYKGALEREGLALYTPERCIPVSWPNNRSVEIFWEWVYRNPA